MENNDFSYRLLVAFLIIVFGAMIIANAVNAQNISLVEISSDDLRVVGAEDQFYVALMSDVPNGSKTAIYMYDFNYGLELYSKHRQIEFNDQYLLFLMPRDVFDEYTTFWFDRYGVAEIPIVYNNGVHATLFLNQDDVFGYTDHGFIDVDREKLFLTENPFR
jgi:hypothetical protein